MSSGQAMFYFLAAVFVSAVPVYLYWTVFDLTQAFVPFYAVVTAVSSTLLTMAYKNVTYRENARLSSHRKDTDSVNHKKLGLSKAQLDFHVKEATLKEATTWSFFINNLVFVLLFVFLSFYMLKDLQTNYNYILSTVVSATLVWQMSSTIA
eukprot:CAMPEP_0205823374 /NCGR_PEP_ID=MMETSP0206-20130828/16249_1 /ASSEMBLY_ACC=CAM_ASM_000279 /TAXON_ID=36767 /ORGANISM="Euplotes focardii, Strain TN1" /LENGTH=150 /DNA_ID=CAMNT_0053120479 /DNA_START=75 /DNA_END=527 /DNA_ORIENTATION=-